MQETPTWLKVDVADGTALRYVGGHARDRRLARVTLTFARLDDLGRGQVGARLIVLFERSAISKHTFFIYSYMYIHFHL